MSAHTPTPWEVDDLAISSVNPPEDYGDIICEAPTGWDDSMKRWEANAARIVQCVNACDGIDDPESEIKTWSNRVQYYEDKIEARNRVLDYTQSELESLRAERDGLVESLRDAWSALKEADRRFSIKTGNALSESITQTLAKYEK